MRYKYLLYTTGLNAVLKPDVSPIYRRLAIIADITNKNQVSCILILADTVNVSELW